MPLSMRYAARSDVGLVREGNEDSGYAGPSLLVVADGMGGHAAGELASAIAVATVADLDSEPLDQAEVLEALAEAVADAGDAIAEVIAADPDLLGMGTTVTGVSWLGDRIALVHVGDSRAYLLRAGDLTQLTHDHTYVQSLIDAGRITEEQALIHPRRSLMLRALDGLHPVEADLSIHEVRAGDRLMLCSDGLCGVLSTQEIAGALGHGDPTGSVTRLVDLALERGAPDNVTVVVADVVDLPEGDRGTAADLPVVVGAAGEMRVRLRLPSIRFPDDAQPDPDRPDSPPPVEGGPPTAPQPLIDADLVVPASSTRSRAASVRGQADRRRRRRLAWTVVGLIVAVSVLAGGVLATASAWRATQWYVAVNGSPGTGTVAVYQGIQGSLLGYRLSTLTSDSQLQVGTLPYFDQELVSKGIPAADEADAQRIISELVGRAQECRAVPAPTGCPGAPQ